MVYRVGQFTHLVISGMLSYGRRSVGNHGPPDPGEKGLFLLPLLRPPETCRRRCRGLGGGRSTGGAWPAAAFLCREIPATRKSNGSGEENIYSAVVAGIKQPRTFCFQ